MSTLLVLGLMFFGAVLSLVLIPLVLLKVVFTLVVALVAIPFKILATMLGGAARVAFKGIFWLALLLVPLALLALPLTVLGLGAWLFYRAIRPRRPPPAYGVA